MESLGAEQLDALYQEQGEAEAVCRFCGEKYHFSGAELQQIVTRLQERHREEEN